MKCTLLFAALVGCAAHTDVPAIDASLTASVDDNKTLVPGQVAEGLWNAKPGDRIVLTLQAASADLDWNIHAHDGGGTQTMIEEFSQMSADYDFDPPEDEQWFLLVRNHGSVVMNLTVHMDIYGSANWAGWQN